MPISSDFHDNYILPLFRDIIDKNIKTSIDDHDFNQQVSNWFNEQQPIYVVFEQNILRKYDISLSEAYKLIEEIQNALINQEIFAKEFLNLHSLRGDQSLAKNHFGFYTHPKSKGFNNPNLDNSIIPLELRSKIEIGFDNKKHTLMLRGPFEIKDYDFLKKICSFPSPIEIVTKEIGELGAYAIINALNASNSQIVKLCFIGDFMKSKDRLSYEAIVALAEMLKTNRTLKELNLELQKIGDGGAKIIAQSLLLNSTLTHLFLGYNKITNEGFSEIYKSLNVNHSLQFIKIDHIDDIDKGLVLAIKAKLRRNLQQQPNTAVTGFDPENSPQDFAIK